MRHRLPYLLALALLSAILAPWQAMAQSDSQTLRSPYASLVAFTDFDLGFAASGGRGYPVSLGANLIGGYQANKLLTVGLGVGLHGYGPSDMLLLPVFADARLHFPQRKWTPYISLDLGYSLSLDSAERGGFLLNPAVGGRFPLGDNLAFGFAVGYRLQPNSAIVNSAFDENNPHFLSLKLGLVMKFPRLSRRVFEKTMGRMKDKSK